MNYVKSVLLSPILCICVTVLSCKQKLDCKKLSTDFFSITAKIKTQEDTLDFIKNLDQLTAENPFCEKAYQVRGWLRMDGRKFSLAKPDFIKALQINDSSVYSLYCLSSLYNFDNINDSALILINKAMSVKYKDGYAIDYNNYFSQRFDIKYNELIFFRGIIYYDLKLLDYARNDFVHLVADNYEVGEDCAYLSAIYQKKNVIDSACYYQSEAQRHGYKDIVDSIPTLSCITSAKN